MSWLNFGVMKLYAGVKIMIFSCPYNVATLGFNVTTLLFGIATLNFGCLYNVATQKVDVAIVR